MTTWCPVARPAVLALVLALCAGPALAQEDEPPEIEEGMLEICPELEDAGPREQNQLIALFFELSPGKMSREERERVSSLFDLEKEEDVAILARYLDSPEKIACTTGLRAVFQAHRAVGLLWLLERYVDASPAARARLLTLLAVFDELEVWRLFQKSLSDKTRVPDRDAAAQAPPGYADLRICDHAMRAIGTLLIRTRGLKLPMERSERAVHSTMPIPERDRRIEAMAAFLAEDEDCQEYLGDRPRLEAGLERLDQRRARSVCEKLGIPPG